MRPKRRNQETKGEMGDREGRKFEKEREPMHEQEQEQEQEQEKEGSAYKHSFVLVVPNHYSKQPCFGLLRAEKPGALRECTPLHD